MLTKRALPDCSGIEPKRRLRQNVVDLFLSNDVSSSRAVDLIQDASAAGAAHFEDLQRLAGAGALKQNAARDLLRKVLRRSHWPKLYHAEVRAWDLKTQKATKVWLPFLLPHELVHVLAMRSSKQALLCQGGMSVETRAHLATASVELGSPELLALGLWLDGVPCNWDRSQSLEVVAMSFPGFTGGQANIRLPITVINKMFCLKDVTFDDILEVIAWSLRCLVTGTLPSKRHDSKDWLPNDAQRRRQGGSPIGSIRLQGVLAEVRGDWSCFKSIFRLPGWNEKAGCCWRCTVTPEGIRDSSLQASWRQPEERLSHWQLVERMLSSGKTLSPLLSAPSFRTSCFLLDWLHCADLGITSDFLGNFLWLLLDKMPGNNKTEQCQRLFLKIKAYYQRHKCDSRLDELTLPMLRKEASVPPKLRAKGAEARALVPFAKEVACELLSDTDLVEGTVKQCAIHLAACYECLSAASFSFPALQEHSRRFCLLYVALEAVSQSDTAWRVKPKLHLFQEMCEASGACPSTCWTYRDEDFGGTLAKLSRRRGGANTPQNTAKVVLQRFMAKHRVPIIS